MKKKIVIIIAAVVVFAVSLLAGIKFSSVSDTDKNGNITTDKAAQTIRNAGIEVSEIFSYSGSFVEDGSDREVSDICAVRIKNTSSANRKLIRFTVTTDTGEVLSFEATTLFGYAEMTVLEKNAAAYTEGMKTADVKFDTVADFDAEPSVFPEIFSITAMDSVINVENISGTDIDSTVYLYYKTVEEGDFFGGITYRIKLEGIKAGEIKQLSVSHFDSEASKVVFVTYE